MINENPLGKPFLIVVRFDRSIVFLNVDVFFITGVLDFTFDIMSSVNHIEHADHGENQQDEEVTTGRPKVRQTYLNFDPTH